eukprot:6174859-Pleurochrysis_carterae.AAC.1
MGVGYRNAGVQSPNGTDFVNNLAVCGIPTSARKTAVSNPGSVIYMGQRLGDAARREGYNTARQSRDIISLEGMSTISFAFDDGHRVRDSLAVPIGCRLL